MPRGPGAARWGWLLLAALLAVLTPLTIGDGGLAGSLDPLEDDEGLPRPALAAAVGPATNLPLLTGIRAARSSAADRIAVARRPVLGPTDRAPPRD